MKSLILILVSLLLIPTTAYSQQCPDGQFYGCGSFQTNVFPYMQRTICGCFNEPDQPIERDVSLASCSNVCLFDGIRSKDGCSCLRGPVVIPDLLTPIEPFTDFKGLRDLKLKNPDLYEIYVDTQINGNNISAPLNIDKFIELSK